MKVIKVMKEYFQTEDEKVYFFEPLEKEVSFVIPVGMITGIEIGSHL